MRDDVPFSVGEHQGRPYVRVVRPSDGHVLIIHGASSMDDVPEDGLEGTVRQRIERHMRGDDK